MEGTICEADTVIMVHDLPNAHFQILTDSLCLNDQNFCVRDLSDMGNTTSVYDNRIVVWGDGGISLDDDPGSGVDICYSGYIDTGSFTITAEIKNDKGCEAKWSDTVEVLPVVLADFSTNIKPQNCDSQEASYENSVQNKPS